MLLVGNTEAHNCCGCGCALIALSDQVGLRQDVKSKNPNIIGSIGGIW
jgi:hypothetical protein